MDKAETLARWLLAAFDALEKQYLRELIFMVYLDPARPEEVHEKFTFSFSYEDGEAKMQLGLGATDSKEVPELRAATQALLREILVVTQSLEKLPEEAYLAIKLTYYDQVTPMDYEPEGFKADTTEEIAMPEGVYTVRLGKVSTAHHGLKVRVDARQGAGASGYVNNTYHASDTESQSQQLSGQVSHSLEMSQDMFEGEASQPLEDEVQDKGDAAGSQSQDLEEDSSQKSEIAASLDSTVSLTVKPEVSCACQTTSRDYLMLLCSICNTFQHAACYRILSAEKVPERHVCWDCSKKNPELPCTDAKMKQFLGKEQLVRGTCVYRRVLGVLAHLVENQTYHVTAASIKSHLGISSKDYNSLQQKMLDQNVVTESVGKLFINLEGLQEDLRKFMGIKSQKDSKKVPSTRVSSKRREERAQVSNSSKKSKTFTEMKF